MDSKRDFTEVTRKIEMNEMKLFSPYSVNVNRERIVNPLTLMVISIDSLLIKQLGELLNVIPTISIVCRQDGKGN